MTTSFYRNGTLTFSDDDKALIQGEGPIDYWDCQESEALSWTKPLEAVACAAADHEPGDGPFILQGYKRMSLPSKEDLAEKLLADLLEDLDCNGIDMGYGDPDDPNEITEPMRGAGIKLAEAIIADYRVWRCEPVVSIEVEIRK